MKLALLQFHLSVQVKLGQRISIVGQDGFLGHIMTLNGAVVCMLGYLFLLHSPFLCFESNQDDTLITVHEAKVHQTASKLIPFASSDRSCMKPKHLCLSLTK